MAGMKLYQFANSSFCEKVRMVLTHKRLPYEKVEVPGDDRTELIQLSGQKLVPVLVDGDQVIVDSTHISNYLEQKCPHPRIYPADAPTLGLALLIEDWADEVLNKAVRPLVRPYELGQETPEPERIRLTGELATCLATLETALSGGNWLLGRLLTIADLSVYAQIWRIKFNPTLTLLPDYANLLAWKDRLEKELVRSPV